MKIFVKARPSAREEKVEKISETNFIIWIKEPPVKNKANKAIIRALAEYFNVASAGVILVAGSTSRQKIFDIKM